MTDTDEITRLRAENERLRAALETISLMDKKHEHDLFSATQVARAAAGGGMTSDITIPPKAVEAAARGMYEGIIHHPNAGGQNAPKWDEVSASDKQALREVATAALRAGIAAWPGMFYHPARPDEEACIFLPLPQEPRDD